MVENTAASRKTEMSGFERVPKVELHLHLEGAIPHDALWELVQKYGGDPSVPDLEALERRFEYRDFSHFIERSCIACWNRTLDVLQTAFQVDPASAANLLTQVQSAQFAEVCPVTG